MVNEIWKQKESPEHTLNSQYYFYTDIITYLMLIVKKNYR